MVKVIEYSCKLKSAVVEQDEKEAGLRAILNLGHTFGHALELCGNYKELLHGEGVSIGMLAASKLARRMNLIDNYIALKYENLIKQFNLKTTIPHNIDINAIIKAMKSDKKLLRGRLRFILPENSIGKVGIFDNIEESILTEVLKELY